MPEPIDWASFHGDNIATLDPEKVEAAVRYLCDMLSPQSKQLIRKLAVRDPQGWWVAHHFHWGMGVRNLLRKGGFTEEYFRMGNLDDYYIGLVELAVGLRGASGPIPTALGTEPRAAHPWWRKLVTWWR